MQPQRRSSFLEGLRPDSLDVRPGNRQREPPGAGSGDRAGGGGVPRGWWCPENRPRGGPVGGAPVPLGPQGFSSPSASTALKYPDEARTRVGPPIWKLLRSAGHFLGIFPANSPPLLFFLVRELGSVCVPAEPQAFTPFVFFSVPESACLTFQKVPWHFPPSFPLI